MRYKVGDRVKIQSLERYNKYKNRYGDINYGCETEILFTSEMSSFCGQVVTITRVRYIGCVRFYHLVEDNGAHLWVDGMFEGLVEEETKPKFKVGDKIKLKSTLQNDIFGVIGYEPGGYSITNISNGLTYFMSYPIEHYYELVEEETKPKFKVGDKITNGKVTLTILTLTPESYVVEDTFGECGTLYFNTKDDWKIVEEEDLILDLIPKFGEYSDNEPLDIPTMTTEFVKEHGLPCPHGYLFKDENGNEIHATKIVLEKKKKEYPKTYEECCEILGGLADYVWGGYKQDLFRTFHMLYICRDAYWKIAGEEMGLGKPWEPDFTNDDEERYGIYTTANKVVKDFCGVGDVNMILTFPTEEMRDAFYENFKEEIEQCKELL